MYTAFRGRRALARAVAGIAGGLVLALAQPAGAAEPEGLFDPTTFTLDNGLRVVVVENRRAPIVTQMLWYKVGAADEPHGKSGLAHVLEHMMFKGTKAHPGDAFSEIVARHGGEQNAFTSDDYTGYYQTVAREHLGLMMRLEADRMTNLRLREEDFRPERRVVVQERLQRVTNDPQSRLQEMASATLYLHHPYGTPVIGWESEIKALELGDLERFYKRWYAPNNAVLVIAGDVAPEKVRTLAEEHYGGIPRGEVPDRDRVSEPDHAAPRRVSLASDQVSQPRLSIRYLAPSYRTAEDRGTPYALQVLDEVLGGGPTSRLYRALVVDEDLAVSAGSWYSPSAYDQASFGFYISPRGDAPIEKVETALRAEIDELLENGVSKQAVADAKTRLRADAVYARDDVSTAPRVIGRALSVGQSVADVEAWRQRIEAVTPADVEAAARRVLTAKRSVTAELTAAGKD